MDEATGEVKKEYLLAFNAEIKVKEGRFSPVAVEGKERNVKVNALLCCTVKGDEALYVHTVFEGCIEVTLVRCGKSYGYVDLCGRAGSNGNNAVGQGTALNTVIRRVGEKVRHLRYVLGI